MYIVQEHALSHRQIDIQRDVQAPFQKWPKYIQEPIKFRTGSQILFKNFTCFVYYAAI